MLDSAARRKRIRSLTSSFLILPTFWLLSALAVDHGSGPCRNKQGGRVWTCESVSSECSVGAGCTGRTARAGTRPGPCEIGASCRRLSPALHPTMWGPISQDSDWPLQALYSCAKAWLRRHPLSNTTVTADNRGLTPVGFPTHAGSRGVAWAASHQWCGWLG